MFNTKRIERLDRNLEYTERDVAKLQRAYSEQVRRFQILLDYLGLSCEHIEEKDIIVKKGEK